MRAGLPEFFVVALIGVLVGAAAAVRDADAVGRVAMSIPAAVSKHADSTPPPIVIGAVFFSNGSAVPNSAGVRAARRWGAALALCEGSSVVLRGSASSAKVQDDAGWGNADLANRRAEAVEIL